jgi:hypothetical protein
MQFNAYTKDTIMGLDPSDKNKMHGEFSTVSSKSYYKTALSIETALPSQSLSVAVDFQTGHYYLAGLNTTQLATMTSHFSR